MYSSVESISCNQWIPNASTLQWGGVNLNLFMVWCWVVERYAHFNLCIAQLYLEAGHKFLHGWVLWRNLRRGYELTRGSNLIFFSANSFDVGFLRADWGELGDGGVLRIDYLLRVNENAIKAYQILVVVLSCLHKSSITRYRLVKTGDVWLILTVLRFYLSFSLGRLTDGTRTS